MWIKPHDDGIISMIGGFGDCDFVEGDGMSDRYFNLWEGEFEFNYGDDGFWYMAFDVDEWYMLTTTYNKWTKSLNMYINAERLRSRSVTLIDTPESSIKLGDVGEIAWVASQSLEQSPLNATIDDFCIWDGELPWMDDDPETDDVLSLYGTWICYEPPAYDIDGDCQVNTADLAELISAWLESGRYPADL